MDAPQPAGLSPRPWGERDPAGERRASATRLELFASERLLWRWWRADDAPLAEALWSDPRVMQRLHVRGVLTPAEARARLELEIGLQREYGFQYWPIFERASGAHVGCAGLRPKDIKRGRLELGFHLRPGFWGRGLATEAAERVVRYAFEGMRVPELYAGHHPELAATPRILRRLGFRYDRDELYPATQRLHRTYLLRPEGFRPLAAGELPPPSVEASG